jgi:hypothetical protein
MMEAEVGDGIGWGDRNVWIILSVRLMSLTRVGLGSLPLGQADGWDRTFSENHVNLYYKEFRLC